MPRRRFGWQVARVRAMGLGQALGALGAGSPLIAADDRPSAATLCCRCRCWQEAQVVAPPGDQMASGRMGGGHMRASDADRERLIDTLKDAFALGQLTRDELVARTARALTSRTCAE